MKNTESLNRIAVIKELKNIVKRKLNYLLLTILVLIAATTGVSGKVAL